MSNLDVILEYINSIPSTPRDDELIETFQNKSCAIVGNGGVLLDHEDGEIIDGHDMVIRSNQTPLGGYTQHTGTRTDLRMVNSHYFTALKGTAPPSHTNFIPQLKAVHPLFDEHYLYTLENEILIVKFGVQKNLFAEEIKRIEEKNNKVIFLNSQFYNLGRNIVGPSSHPTNGFMAMLVGLKFFKEVSYFGFGFYNEEKKHYYQTIQEHLDSASCHNMSAEQEFFNKLIENNLAKKRGL